jgi:integrase
VRGSVFKRCTRCTYRVQGKRCERCGRSDRINWGYAVDLGTDANGKRSQRVRSGFATRKDAEKALRELIGRVDRGAVAPGLPPALGAYLLEVWLPATQPPHVSWTTWRDRRGVITWYVEPRIGHIRLDRLGAADINRLYTDLLTNGRLRTSGGLSPSTVGNVHRILRKALRDAVRWGLIATSPVDRADPPPARIARAARRRAIKVWTAEELRQFLAAAEQDELHPLWLVAATTGLRRSELLGLRWQDLDVDAGRLTVRQTVLQQQGGSAIIDGQKRRRRAHAPPRSTHRRRLAAPPRSAARDPRRDRSGVAGARPGVLPGRWPLGAPGPGHQAVRPAGRTHRGATDQAARRPAQPRFAAAAGRRASQGRVRAAWAQLRGVHPRHLQPRPARDAPRGRRAVRRPGVRRRRDAITRRAWRPLP